MKNLIFRTTLAFIVIAVSACTNQLYMSPEAGMLASVQFSGKVTGIPEINIIVGCRSSQIKENLIKVMAGEVTTFEYNDNWLSSREQTDIRSSALLSGMDSMKVVKTKETLACSNSITFIPEENKNYRIIYGHDEQRCLIKAVELEKIKESIIEVPVDVALVKKQKC